MFIRNQLFKMSIQVNCECVRYLPLHLACRLDPQGLAVLHLPLEKRNRAMSSKIKYGPSEDNGKSSERKILTGSPMGPTGPNSPWSPRSPCGVTVKPLSGGDTDQVGGSTCGCSYLLFCQQVPVFQGRLLDQRLPARKQPKCLSLSFFFILGGEGGWMQEITENIEQLIKITTLGPLKPFGPGEPGIPWKHKEIQKHQGETLLSRNMWNLSNSKCHSYCFSLRETLEREGGWLSGTKKHIFVGTFDPDKL